MPKARHMVSVPFGPEQYEALSLRAHAAGKTLAAYIRDRLDVDDAPVEPVRHAGIDRRLAVYEERQQAILDHYGSIEAYKQSDEYRYGGPRK